MADRVHKTRFDELGYVHEFGHWRIVDVTDDREFGVRIGARYPTREALKDDLERYAVEFGCDNADRLLAAAPTMIHVLQEFTETVWTEKSAGFDHSDNLNEVYQAARAAIAQATGEPVTP